jgi:hypothetical protein
MLPRDNDVHQASVVLARCLDARPVGMTVHRQPCGPAVADPASGDRCLDLRSGRADDPNERRHLGRLETERTGDLLRSSATRSMSSGPGMQFSIA